MKKTLLLALFLFISVFAFSQEPLTAIISSKSDKSSLPRQYVELNGVLFFTATEGTELWKTDGTAEGTVLPQNIYQESIPDPVTDQVYGLNLGSQPTGFYFMRVIGERSVLSRKIVIQ